MLLKNTLISGITKGVVLFQILRLGCVELKEKLTPQPAFCSSRSLYLYNIIAFFFNLFVTFREFRIVSFQKDNMK